jgi:hypothetical protein
VDLKLEAGSDERVQCTMYKSTIQARYKYMMYKFFKFYSFPNYCLFFPSSLLLPLTLLEPAVKKMKFWTGLLAVASVQGQTLDAYMCSFCTSVIAEIQHQTFRIIDHQHSELSTTNIQNFDEACATLYPSGQDYCMYLTTALAKTGKSLQISKEKPARDICEASNMCETLNDEGWRFAPKAENSLDLRVSKAYGSRGYDKVRVSVISNTTIDSDIFTYSEPFQYRWTENVLNTGIVTVTPGEKKTLTIGSESIDIFIPVQGQGTRGVLIADPCFTSEYIVCLYKKPFEIFDHLTSLLNAINSHDDNHFWMVLGDNFYDQKGDNTKTWFSALTTASKSKVFATVPGNVSQTSQLYMFYDILKLIHICFND